MVITFEPHGISFDQILHTQVNIPLPLACKTTFYDGRGFAEHQSSLLWSVSENHHISWTVWDTWIKCAYLFILILSSHWYYPGIQFRLPCTPQDNFSCVPNCSLGPPGWETKVSSKKNLVWAMWNCMVSMPTHSEFEKGGLPIKLLISQLLLILDY